MKNIHILPTDKPSNFYFIKGKHKLSNSTISMDWYISSVGYKPHNIYITNNKQIKTRDWAYAFRGGKHRVEKAIHDDLTTWKKIILTTDRDLIKDGVQAIPDEFLKWFVKNPSCEEVEVDSHFVDFKTIGKYIKEYLIIIPKEKPKYSIKKKYVDEQDAYGYDVLVKEEPKHDYNDVHFTHCYQGEYENSCKYSEHDCPAKTKQEIIEDIAEDYANYNEQINKAVREAVIFGAKWQQKNSYSDMQEYAEFCINCYDKGLNLITVKDWFEQFKKR